MSTVAQRPKARTQPPAAAPRPAAAPADPARTPASFAAAFISMGSMLEISATGWAHWAGSCDAARLLLMARADIEEHAQRNINEEERAGDFALDIAALIKAARRAPGPAEPAEAKKLLDQAMADLAWIADMPVAELMEDAAAPAAQQQDQEERLKLARGANYQIERLAQTLILLADQLESDAQPVFHGMAARIAQLSGLVYFAGQLHGEDPATVGTPPLSDLQSVFEGGLRCG
ncbi:hypothetical protein ACUTR7_03800 [Delftia sp. NA_296.1]|uniref:hypothetical protein n=1 Tax=Delftia sp. NA_296.1 TaxID=3415648 RepID=UPI00404624A4